MPGEFKTVMPFLNAKPLRGRICASYPLCNSINNPVGTNVLSKGFSSIGESIFALKSNPADNSVAYCGNSCLDWFCYCISRKFTDYL